MNETCVGCGQPFGREVDFAEDGWCCDCQELLMRAAEAVAGD